MQLPGESFFNSCANTPDQIANHAVDRSIELGKFINQFVHCILGFTSIDPGISKKDDDQEHDENNDQDCF